MSKKQPSLRKKLVLTSYISILVPVLIICVIFYGLLSNNAVKAQTAADRDLLEQIGENTYYTVEMIEGVIRNIGYSTELQQLLRGYETANQGNQAAAVQADALTLARIAANKTLQNQAYTIPYMNKVMVFSTNGELLGSTELLETNVNIKQFGWFSQVEDSDGESIWLSGEEAKVTVAGHSRRLIPVAKTIRNLAAGDLRFASDIGYILVYIDLDWLLNSIAPKGSFPARDLLLLSSEGAIISGKSQAVFQETFPFGYKTWQSGVQVKSEAGQSYLLSSQQVRVNGWYVVCLSEKGAVIHDAKVALAICSLVGVLLLGVFFVFSTRSANSVVVPVVALRKAFKAVETGDFSPLQFPVTNILELDDLTARFEVMVKRLDRLVQEEYQARIRQQELVGEVQKTQIQSLQMQINPHFIYNTLDSINWMAMMGGNEDVSQMAQALGDFLRFNVSVERLTCTLEDEIKNTQRFMYIQRVRFEPRLQYSFEVAPEVYHYKVLKLLLQPLAENAIRHGMEPWDKNCTVHITIAKIEEKLRVVVQDDGQGMRPDILLAQREMWHRIMGGEGYDAEKVGLSNLMRRLYLCYGEQAEFTIDSWPEKGTAVSIAFPAEVFIHYDD